MTTETREINSLVDAQRVGEGTDHIAHLISDILQPRLESLRPRNHAGNLRADDWLVRQGFSEGLTLVNPLEGTLNDASL